MSLDTKLHGEKTGLMKQGVMLLTAEVILELLNPFRDKKPVLVPTTILVQNPFGSILTIQDIQFQVLTNDTSKSGGGGGSGGGSGSIVVGTAEHNGLNIEIPRYGEVWIPPVQLKVELSQHFNVIAALLIKMENVGRVNVTLLGNFTFVTGGLVFRPKNYLQLNNVPCCIQLPESERHYCPPAKEV